MSPHRPPLADSMDSRLRGNDLGVVIPAQAGIHDSRGGFLELVGGFGLAIIISLICGFLAGFYWGFREYIVPLNGLFRDGPASEPDPAGSAS